MFRDPASYIAAIIDGEGSIDDSGRNRRVVIYNTDEELIEICKECLSALGIGYHCKPYDRRSRRSSHKICFRLVIARRDDLERLSRIVPLAPVKRRRLDALMAKYKARISTNEIVDWYRQGYTAAEIAEVYECSPTLVYNRLKEARESRRVRGSRSLHAEDCNVAMSIPVEVEA